MAFGQEIKDTYSSESYSRIRPGRKVTNDTLPCDTFPEKEQQHLILRHSQSGDLYCSKLPASSTITNYFEDSDPDLQLKMPSSALNQQCFTRWFLTLLHALTCLVSGFCAFFSFFSTYFSDHCLPHLVNKDGSSIKSHFGFISLCDGVLSGLGFVFIVSLVLSGLVQISLHKTPLVLFSLFLTTCMTACSVMAGSMFTVHFTLWCDSIAQSLSHTHNSCDKAAADFDKLQGHKSSNMAGFETQMEIQQITAWTLFPLTFMTLLCYALALRWGQVSPQQEDSAPPRGFYQYLATQSESNREQNRLDSGNCDERSPFLQ